MLRRRVLLGSPLAYCSCFWTHTAGCADQSVMAANRFGNHSQCCLCGGGATESNSLLACRTQAAGLQTEVEKPGLLPPHVNGAPEDRVRRLAGRRPADVWSGLRSPKAYAFEHKIVCVAEGLNSFPWSSRLLAGGRRPPCRKLEGNRWRPKPMRVQKRRRRTWSHPA